ALVLHEPVLSPRDRAHARAFPHGADVRRPAPRARGAAPRLKRGLTLRGPAGDRRRPMKLPPPPRLSGRTLRTIVRATEADSVRRAVGSLVRADLGIPAALALPAS